MTSWTLRSLLAFCVTGGKHAFLPFSLKGAVRIAKITHALLWVRGGMTIDLNINYQRIALIFESCPELSFLAVYDYLLFVDSPNRDSLCGDHRHQPRKWAPFAKTLGGCRCCGIHSGGCRSVRSVIVSDWCDILPYYGLTHRTNGERDQKLPCDYCTEIGPACLQRGPL